MIAHAKGADPRLVASRLSKRFHKFANVFRWAPKPPERAAAATIGHPTLRERIYEMVYLVSESALKSLGRHLRVFPNFSPNHNELHRYFRRPACGSAAATPPCERQRAPWTFLRTGSMSAGVQSRRHRRPLRLSGTGRRGTWQKRRLQNERPGGRGFAYRGSVVLKSRSRKFSARLPTPV
jgi:hypothetical protein